MRFLTVFDDYKLQEYDPSYCYEHIINDAIPAINSIEHNGMLIDKKQLSKIQKKYEKKVEEGYEHLQKKAEEFGWNAFRYLEETDAKSHPGFFNCNSPQQAAYVFHDLLDLPKYRGDRTTSEKARNWWKKHKLEEGDSDKRDFIESFDSYKGQKKRLSSTIKPIWDYIDEDDRVRPSIIIYGAETGRTAQTSPNLQQIPRDDEIKDVFTSRDGYKLLETDYSQAELRVLAILSDDIRLKTIYLGDLDVHNITTEQIFGEDWGKQERTYTKSVNYGIGYGLTYKSLAQRYGFEKGFAKELYEEWYDTYEEAGNFLDACSEACYDPGYLYSWFGRKRRAGLVTEDNAWHLENEFCNFPMQSTASDLTLRSATEVFDLIQDEYWNAQLVNFVHDSVVLEVKEEQAKELASEITELMEEIAQREMKTDMPFKSDAEIGDSWGSLKEVNL